MTRPDLGAMPEGQTLRELIPEMQSALGELSRSARRQDQDLRDAALAALRRCCDEAEQIAML